MKNKLFLRACAVGLFSLSMLFGLGQHIAHAEQGQHAQQTHQIDYAQSHVYFSAAHAGNAFRGEFQEWQGEAHFDPTDLMARCRALTGLMLKIIQRRILKQPRFWIMQTALIRPKPPSLCVM